MWQMGIEMRPLITKGSAWAYPWYGAVGGIWGYWLMGVEESQLRFIEKRKQRFLEKKARQEERDRKALEEAAATDAEPASQDQEGRRSGFVLGWK